MSNERSHSTDMASRRHELLQEVADTVRAVLSQFPEISPAAAELAANASADMLANRWGGQLINFPKDFRFRNLQRETAIYQAFQAGATIGDLARQYDTHERTIRRTIDKVRAHIRSSNRDLFEG